MQTQGENIGRNFAKSSKTWQNHENLKKQKYLLSFRGWNKWWDFLKLMTECDDRWWKSWWSLPMITFSQSECQSKFRQNRMISCFSEQSLKNLKLKIDAFGYRLTILRPRGQVDKRYGQIVWSPFPYPIMFLGGGGGGQRKGGGGVSGPDSMVNHT
jgi:hypothetical protein